MRLYLDTAPIIYTVENVPVYAQTVDKRLAIPGNEIASAIKNTPHILIYPPTVRSNSFPQIAKKIYNPE
jgi:hypothetical protein